MKQSVFIVEKMDCPSEEQLVRGRLQGLRDVLQVRLNRLGGETRVSA